MNPQSVGINVQSPQSESTPRRLTLGVLLFKKIIKLLLLSIILFSACCDVLLSALNLVFLTKMKTHFSSMIKNLKVCW